ncbi:MAG TPA: hypothetical protein VJM10_02340 [Candidatus Methylomirabilis sp.]|nr:hypothetical protein [Candidatus Methylomirabilis sp.]
MADEQKDPNQPDLAGYPNTDELVKGYRSSGEEAKKQKERADRAEAAVQALLAQQEAANPRQDVPKRDPYGRLAEYGVPADAVREAIRMEAREELKEALEPIMRGFQARQTLLGKYKDYAKFESDVATYIQSDPETSQTYNRLFQADPVGAFEYAFLKFGQEARSKRGQKGSGQSTEEATEAQIPTARSGDARRIPSGY